MCRVHAEVTIGDGWLCCVQSLCAEYHGGPTFSVLFCAWRSCVSAKACPRAAFTRASNCMASFPENCCVPMQCITADGGRILSMPTLLGQQTE